MRCYVAFFSFQANQISHDHFHSARVLPGHLSLCSQPFPSWLTNKPFLTLFVVRAVFCTDSFFFLFIKCIYLLFHSRGMGWQLLGVSFHLQPNGTSEFNLVHQSWWYALATEPSHCPYILSFKNKQTSIY